jgi:hypothetical protein
VPELVTEYPLLPLPEPEEEEEEEEEEPFGMMNDWVTSLLGGSMHLWIAGCWNVSRCGLQ